MNINVEEIDYRDKDVDGRCWAVTEKGGKKYRVEFSDVSFGSDDLQEIKKFDNDEELTEIVKEILQGSFQHDRIRITQDNEKFALPLLVIEVVI